MNNTHSERGNTWVNKGEGSAHSQFVNIADNTSRFILFFQLGFICEFWVRCEISR